MSPRTGRRAGDPGTRDAILAAARRAFGEHGFAGATIRGIATGAGVDPALVLHYYGSKADLFTAAVAIPVSPSREMAVLDTVAEDELGEALLGVVLGIWRQPGGLDAWMGLLRSAVVDERAATLLREFLASAVFEPVTRRLDVPDAHRRVALAASQVVGLGIARFAVRLEPLASMPEDELVAAVAPTLQRYLTGELTPESPDPPDPPA